MSHATTPGPPPSAPPRGPEAPGRSRWSRMLWGRPLTVERAWVSLAIGQIAVFAALYAATGEVADWGRALFLVGAVALEINYAGQLVQAYRHRRRRRELPYDVG